MMGTGMVKDMKYSTVIVAAGRGQRMNLGFNKVYAKLSDGRTILEHAMDIFMADDDCLQITVVTDAEDYYHNVKGRWPGKISITEGGDTRQQSVSNGLDTVIAENVFIHDGARPFLDKDSLERLKKTMETEQAALLCVPTKDTIKVVIDGFITETPDRNTLMNAQTPQAFRTSLLLDCMAKARAEGFTGTDDTSLIERYSDVKVKAVEGSYSNIKITTPEDLNK
jgi:2-C-methyl-D-erythritol 4-phosphate cytidylyltransferase